MLDLSEYLNINEIKNYKNVKENMITIAEYAVGHYFADKPLFKTNNFKYYYYDDYSFDTNTSFNNYMTLYIEINQPNNVKEVQIEKKDDCIIIKAVQPAYDNLLNTLNKFSDDYMNERVQLKAEKREIF